MKKTANSGREPVGEHAGCGGTIVYSWTYSRAWRTCNRCGASSARGISPDTVAEVAARAAFKTTAPAAADLDEDAEVLRRSS